MKLLAIDPGPVESGYVVYCTGTRRIAEHGIVPNEQMRLICAVEHGGCEHAAIEMIAHYGSGMPAGRSVFETCVWIGRFVECWHLGSRDQRNQPKLIMRKDVKMYLCGSTRAKDPNVRQAIIDLFGRSKEQSIGNKKAPGPLYGIRGHEWAALGVALAWTDQRLRADA